MAAGTHDGGAAGVAGSHRNRIDGGAAGTHDGGAQELTHLPHDRGAQELAHLPKMNNEVINTKFNIDIDISIDTTHPGFVDFARSRAPLEKGLFEVRGLVWVP